GVPEAPFRPRPGLVAEMLRFYDQLKLQGQSVDRFQELIEEALEGDRDRGARRMQQQTHFLAAMFREYERRVREGGACDEHMLRTWLLEEACARPIRHLVVT